MFLACHYVTRVTLFDIFLIKPYVETKNASQEKQRGHVLSLILPMEGFSSCMG